MGKKCKCGRFLYSIGKKQGLFGSSPMWRCPGCRKPPVSCTCKRER